jgi:hypothetical protein
LSTGDPVDGCLVAAGLGSGDNRGGDENDFDSRPLGSISPLNIMSDDIEIPPGGINLEYEAPEVSGDVDVTLSETGPNGRNIMPYFLRFEIAAGEFKPLEVPGLDFVIVSHPSGYAGTDRMQTRLRAMVKRFQFLIQTDANFSGDIPTLESESASLPNGGLFDIDYVNGSAWAPPHCGHRDGETADISYSIVSNYTSADRDILIKALKRAFHDANLRSTLEIIENEKHWHIHTN